MPATREQVMTALLATVSKIADFQTVARKLKFDPQMGPTASPSTPDPQPALYLLQDQETTMQQGPAPPRRIWRVSLLIWCKIPQGPLGGQPDNSILGDTIINGLLEKLEAAMADDNLATGYFTLGGLVLRCWIEGQTVRVSGDFSPEGQCFLGVPISIMVP